MASRDDDAAQKHLRRLTEDDGFLVYYGQCGYDWVAARVAEIAAIEASGRVIPLPSRAVLLADPATDEKEDFLTHDATIVGGFGVAGIEAALTAFVAEIRKSWDAGLSHQRAGGAP